MSTPMSNDVGELVEQLNDQVRVFGDKDRIMRDWGSWRKYIAGGGGASWPRDAFEALIDCVHEDCRDAATALSSQAAEIAEMRKALEPFAARAFLFDGQDGDWFCSVSMQIKDFRRAAALTRKEG